MVTFNTENKNSSIKQDGPIIPLNQSYILSGVSKNVSLIKGISTMQMLDEFHHLRITKEKDIPQPDPTITIGGAAFASPGNISVISAMAKAGKTAFTGVLLAGAISDTGEIDGFPDVYVEPNLTKKAVIQFDTEQSEADHQYNVNTILKRAGLEETPSNFLAYNIRQLSISEYKKVTENICKVADELFKGVHLIVIDGGGDYIESVNDESSANLIIQFFTHLSIKHNCPVIIIVHQNPGSEKERGHFGSELQRKCFGLVGITRDRDISTLQPKIMRKAGFNDVPLISYMYSKEKGYHVPINAPDKEQVKSDKERLRHAEIAQSVFSSNNSYSYTQVVQMIMQATSKGERTAKTMVANMAGWGQIEKGVDNNYRLVQKGATQCNLHKMQG